MADATGEFGHVPVLLDRCFALLRPALTRHHPDGSGAVLIDATIVRGVLLPAGLALLGDRAFGSRRRYGATASMTVSEPPPHVDKQRAAMHSDR